MNPDAVIEVRGGRFGYRGTVAAAADLCIGRGEVVALLGPNGSGKTTLMKGMLGLVEKMAGTVSLFGQHPGQVRDRSGVGYLPQRQSAAGPIPVTVRELVRSGCQPRHAPWNFRRSAPSPSSHRKTPPERFCTESVATESVQNLLGGAAVEAAIREVGLSDQAKRPVATLSGGQQRRALLARALVGAPQLLLLDEPFAGVDQENQHAIAATLAARIEIGATLVVVLHELGPLEPLVTRAICMDHGAVGFDGPIADAPPRLLHLGHDHDPHGGPEPRQGLGLIGPRP